MKGRAGKMVRWMKMCYAKQDNLILLSEIHMVQSRELTLNKFASDAIPTYIIACIPTYPP